MKNSEFKLLLITKSFNFSIKLVNFVSGLSVNEFFKVTSNQVLRSGLSIGANISEGQGASSKNEFKIFINHAYKSSIETRYWLALIEKCDYKVDRSMLSELIRESKEISKILASIIFTLKGKKTVN